MPKVTAMHYIDDIHTQDYYVTGDGRVFLPNRKDIRPSAQFYIGRRPKKLTQTLLSCYV